MKLSNHFFQTKNLHKSILCLSLLGLSLSPSVYAAESETLRMGAELFQEANCMQCHSEKTFYNGQPKVKTFDRLVKQVQMCDSNLKIGWFDDEVHAVAEYLNQTFYHLAK